MHVWYLAQQGLFRYLYFNIELLSHSLEYYTRGHIGGVIEFRAIMTHTKKTGRLKQIITVMMRERGKELLPFVTMHFFDFP